MNGHDGEAIQERITQLEKELEAAKASLHQWCATLPATTSDNEDSSQSVPVSSINEVPKVTVQLASSTHNLILLSDSALPLGSFAYSSGLESFLAHHRPLPPGVTVVSLFRKFLALSIQSVASTNIPYVLESFRNPTAVAELDNDFDASTPCTVARRASVAQGRALLSVWEKAFATVAGSHSSHEVVQAALSLRTFARELKIGLVSSSQHLPIVNGHAAPLWGPVCLTLGLSLEETGYLFLLNHAKAVVSAGIRASVLGPYLAQHLLASSDLQDLVKGSLERVWNMPPEEAGQVVPTIDLWIGRHELLYSRIFNS